MQVKWRLAFGWIETAQTSVGNLRRSCHAIPNSRPLCAQCVLTYAKLAAMNAVKTMQITASDAQRSAKAALKLVATWHLSPPNSVGASATIVGRKLPDINKVDGECL